MLELLPSVDMGQPENERILRNRSPFSAAEQPLSTLSAFGVAWLAYSVDGRVRDISERAARLLEECAGLAVALRLLQASGLAPHDQPAPTASGDFSPTRQEWELTMQTVITRGEILRVVVIHATPPSKQQRESGSQYGLSRRESQVAGLIADGCSTKEIAALLGLSVHTVRHHTERVFAKVGVRGRIRVAMRLGRAAGESW